jgi:hypothetical protein
MPIKWSAVKVDQAMDDVEHQINLAESFLAEAKAKAGAVRKIANLPQYVDQRLVRLICDIERIDNVRSAIEAVRKSIPEGAIEAERERIMNGSQQSLI